MLSTTAMRAYRFFREYAGGWVGHNAETALKLTRAETLLEDAEDAGVASAEWVHDPDPYDAGDVTAEEARELFNSNKWTGPFGCIIRVNGEVAADLWGIVVGPRETDDPYCRVVRAELAAEASDQIRDALANRPVDKDELRQIAEDAFLFAGNVLAHDPDLAGEEDPLSYWRVAEVAASLGERIASIIGEDPATLWMPDTLREAGIVEGTL